MEAWVYPLKLLRDFRLQFHTEGRALPAETLARTLITRPESSTIVYTGDTFSVRETFFVPVNEPGAIISLEVETEFPLEIEARFLRDSSSNGPQRSAARTLFGTKTARILSGRGNQKFAAWVGSPTATEERGEYQTNTPIGSEFVSSGSYEQRQRHQAHRNRGSLMAGRKRKHLQETSRQLRGAVASVRGVLQKISERHGQRGIAGCADPASL